MTNDKLSVRLAQAALAIAATAASAVVLQVGDDDRLTRDAGSRCKAQSSGALCGHGSDSAGGSIIALLMWLYRRHGIGSSDSVSPAGAP